MLSTLETNATLAVVNRCALRAVARKAGIACAIVGGGTSHRARRILVTSVGRVSRMFDVRCHLVVLVVAAERAIGQHFHRSNRRTVAEAMQILNTGLATGPTVTFGGACKTTALFPCCTRLLGFLDALPLALASSGRITAGVIVYVLAVTNGGDVPLHRPLPGKRYPAQQAVIDRLAQLRTRACETVLASATVLTRASVSASRILNTIVEVLARAWIDLCALHAAAYVTCIARAFGTSHKWGAFSIAVAPAVLCLTVVDLHTACAVTREPKVAGARMLSRSSERTLCVSVARQIVQTLVNGSTGTSGFGFALVASHAGASCLARSIKCAREVFNQVIAITGGLLFAKIDSLAVGTIRRGLVRRLAGAGVGPRARVPTSGLCKVAVVDWVTITGSVKARVDLHTAEAITTETFSTGAAALVGPCVRAGGHIIFSTATVVGEALVDGLTLNLAGALESRLAGACIFAWAAVHTVGICNTAIAAISGTVVNRITFPPSASVTGVAGAGVCIRASVLAKCMGRAVVLAMFTRVLLRAGNASALVSRQTRTRHVAELRSARGEL